MRPIQSINGTSPGIEPCKGGYRVTKSDLYSDSTGRSSETGAMLPYLIRTDIATLDLEYHGTASEIAGIESLIAGIRFPVTFLDGTSYSTRYFYPSDRERDCDSLRDEGQVVLRFSLIEY